MRHRIQTCTQQGVTASQPGMNVSVHNFAGRHILCVSRHYSQLRNEFGGKGRTKRCDADGLEFVTSDAAFHYAHQRGYLRQWFPNKKIML